MDDNRNVKLSAEEGTAITAGNSTDEEVDFISFSEDVDTPETLFKFYKETHKSKSDNAILWALEMTSAIKLTSEEAVNDLKDQYHELFQHSTSLIDGVVEEIIDSAGMDNFSNVFQNIIAKDVQSTENREKVLVYPFMCGMGKSIAITRQILYTINSPDNNGLLIVTDRDERLTNYIEIDKDDPKKCPYTREYLKTQISKICLLNKERYEEEKIYRDNKKILLMTVQRLHRMPIEEIKKLRTWGSNNPRSLVIFDEEPEVLESLQIGIPDLDEIQTAIGEGFPIEDARREFFAGHWEKVRNAFLNICRPIEEETNGTALYFFKKLEALDEEDNQRFLEILGDKEVRKHLDTFIRGEENDIAYRVRQILQFFTQPVLFCTRNDKGNFKTTFCLLQDNCEHFTALVSDETRVVIFDGTADVCPNYELHKEVFFFPDVENYKRSLSGLNIHVYNQCCGNATILGMKDAAREKFILNIKDIANQFKSDQSAKSDQPTKSDQSLALFTFEKAEEYFKKHFAMTEHFNNIEGKNKFRDCDVIAQVGINYYLPEYYTVYTMALCPEFREKILGSDDIEFHHELIENESKKELSDTWKIITRFICVDIEQNLFRGTIRNFPITQLLNHYSSLEEDRKAKGQSVSRDVILSDESWQNISKEYHFLIFFNFLRYNSVLEFIKKRFEPLNGRVIIDRSFRLIATNYIEKIKRTGTDYKDSNMSKFIRCLKNLDPVKSYTKAQLLEMSGVSDSWFHDFPKTELGNYLLDAIKDGHNSYVVGDLFSEPGMELLLNADSIR